MAQSDEDLLGTITHADRRVFEDALHRLQTRRGSKTPGFEILRDLLGALNAADLGPSELSSRTSIIIKACNPEAHDHAALATLARGLRAEMKTAVVGFLPPSQKKLVYAAQAPKAVREGGADAVSPTTTNERQPASEADADPTEARTVLLLGSLQDHEANLTTLREKKFTPLRASRPEELDLLLTTDTCGIIVAKSWWAALPPEQHEACLRRLIEHSTFARLKVDVSGFRLGDLDLRALCQSILFREPGAFEMTFQDGCNVHTLEIPSLQRASDLLSCPSRIQLRPAEIGEEQARVLLGAAAKHVDARNIGSPFRLSKVATSTIPGGRSKALVIRVEPDDGGSPLVAKIDGLANLREEMRRFHQFIAWSDHRLSPGLHYHADTALIIFSLVETPGNPGSPAPTLEDCIDRAMSKEIWDAAAAAQAEGNFAEAIDRAVRKLRILNGRPCRDPDSACWAWLGLDTFDSATTNGMAWAFSDIHGRERDILAIRHRALEIIKPRERLATVHGDMHLRNILIRDEREPCFIDYAYSGPGHPCFDLVRLESAMLFRCFRMMANETTIAQLLVRILEDCDDEAQLAVEFPQFVASLGNRLAIRTCIRCRRAALDILREYGGGEEDYLAVKFVLACQSLCIPHLQTGVVRATLVAIYAKVAAAWAPNVALAISLPSLPDAKVRELSPL